MGRKYYDEIIYKLTQYLFAFKLRFALFVAALNSTYLSKRFIPNKWIRKHIQDDPSVHFINIPSNQPGDDRRDSSYFLNITI